MNNTNALMSEDSAGLPSTKPAMPALKPWEIAELPLFRFVNGQMVDVEQASDQQFEAWRKRNGIPAKAGAWSFERRCKAINQCRFYGHWSALKFPVDFSADAPTGAQIGADSAPNNAETVPGSAEPAPIEETPDKLLMALELLRSKPDATDLEVMAALGLKTQGVARMWKIKARDLLAQEARDGGKTAQE